VIAGHCPHRSRRWLLQAFALATGGGLVRAAEAETNRAIAWQKFSKQLAGYVEHSHGGPQSCGLCHYFIDPDQCVIVEGPVNPTTGWCNYGATTG
jgi:hypothetical protein